MRSRLTLILLALAFVAQPALGFRAPKVVMVMGEGETCCCEPEVVPAEPTSCCEAEESEPVEDPQVDEQGCQCRLVPAGPPAPPSPAPEPGAALTGEELAGRIARGAESLIVTVHNPAPRAEAHPPPGTDVIRARGGGPAEMRLLLRGAAGLSAVLCVSRS